MKLIVLMLSVLVALGSWEMLRHVLHRRRIPVRIHVNGSRGKSSVARLIAAGLRAGGLRVVAKTTGSTARVIHTDGSETPVRRRGGPNIREQLGIMRGAAREDCEALVIECMAVRPDLQRVCEHNIVKATHGVITNVRPDHLEVMGPTLDDVAASLAGTVPSRSHLYTAEDTYGDFFRKRARRARSAHTNCTADGVTDAELARFSYVEFPENVSLALAVCRDVGVSRTSALSGMWQVNPDVGALTRWHYREACRREDDPGVTDIKDIEFINGFAANDPDSYVRVWRRLGLVSAADEVMLVMNIRADRMRRSKDLAPLFGRELPAGRYVLIGQETALFADMLRRRGLPGDRISDLSRLPAAALWEALVGLATPRCTIVGIGNIGGIGNALLDHLRNKESAA